LGQFAVYLQIHLNFELVFLTQVATDLALPGFLLCFLVKIQKIRVVELHVVRYRFGFHQVADYQLFLIEINFLDRRGENFLLVVDKVQFINQKIILLTPKDSPLALCEVFPDI
jgi:hypothetical protein